MKYILYIILIIVISCGPESKQGNTEVHYFDKYTYSNELFSRNVMIAEIRSVNDLEKIISYEGRPGKYWFREDFSEKVIPEKGIYRKFDDDYTLCYKFDSLHSIVKANTPEKSLFFYPEIILVEIKKLTVNNEQYRIYSYSEYWGTSGMTSYYLEGFGFIAFDLGNGYYLLCNRTSNDSETEKKILTSVSRSIVSDTSFFSIYMFKK